MQRSYILCTIAALSVTAASAADVILIENVTSAYQKIFGSSTNLLAHPFDGTVLLTWNRAIDAATAPTKTLGYGAQLSRINLDLIRLMQTLQTEIGGYITAENGLALPAGQSPAVVVAKLEKAFNDARETIVLLRSYAYTASTEKTVYAVLEQLCYKMTDTINQLLSLVNMTRTTVASVHGIIQGNPNVDYLKISARAKRIENMKGLYWAAADTKLRELNAALGTIAASLTSAYGSWFKQETVIVPVSAKDRASAEAYLSATKKQVRAYYNETSQLAEEKTSNTEFQAIRKELADYFYTLEQEIDRLLIALRTK